MAKFTHCIRNKRNGGLYPVYIRVYHNKSLQYINTGLLVGDNSMSKYICARPVHPGEILKEEIEYRGIPQVKLAAQIGMSYKELNHILNEHRPLTPVTAMLFEAALGIPADMLIGMQIDYNMRILKQDKTFSNRLAGIRKMTAVL
jgi:addiction module HigA family antidote